MRLHITTEFFTNKYLTIKTGIGIFKTVTSSGKKWQVPNME